MTRDAGVKIAKDKAAKLKTQLEDANTRIAELEAGPRTEYAAPARVAKDMTGTNAQKIAALEHIIGVYQARLKSAGLGVNY